MKVWKYELPEAAEWISVPMGAKFLSFQVQDKFDVGLPTRLYAWFLVDPDAKLHPWRFIVAMTGSDVPDGWRYLGTSTTKGYELVFHLFEKAS